MTFIAMILEAFGLSLVIPLISIIINTNFYENNVYLGQILDFLGRPTKETFIFFFLFFLVFYFLFLNLYF